MTSLHGSQHDDTCDTSSNLKMTSNLEPRGQNNPRVIYLRSHHGESGEAARPPGKGTQALYWGLGTGDEEGTGCSRGVIIHSPERFEAEPKNAAQYNDPGTRNDLQTTDLTT